VSDAVKSASGPPTHVLAILANSVTASLGVSPKERDAYQKAFIEMVDAVLRGEEGLLRDAVRAAEASLATASSDLETCEAEAKKLEDALAAKEQDIKGKEEQLAEAKAGLAARHADLKTAEASQVSLNGDIGKRAHEKEVFEKLISEHFEVLRDNPPSHRKSVQKHSHMLVKAIAPLEPEEALTIGIPISMSKQADERTSFDKMLIDHLGKLLAEQVEKCTSRIASSDGEVADSAAAVETAEGSVTTAEAQQTTCSEALTAAEKEATELQAQLKAAQKRIKEQAKEARKAELHKAESEHDLAEFGEALDAFATERDRAEEPPAGELSAEEAPAP
jgi:chromosome segregation ATPase